jgi:dynein heavy chain 1
LLSDLWEADLLGKGKVV